MYDENYNCVFCGYGTILQNGFCQGTTNCKTVSFDSNNKTFCLNCRAGYTNYQGMCMSSQGCFSFNKNGGCNRCKIGFILSGLDCVSVIKLPPSFSLNNTIITCSLFNSIGNCNLCKPGYMLDKTSQNCEKDTNEKKSYLGRAHS
jgi:hypothetical protein